VDAQSQESAVAVEGQLGGGEVIAGLGIGDEALAPRRHPLDRAAESLRRPRHDRLLRVVLALVSEAATHVRRDHPHAALGKTELNGHGAPDEVRDLRRGIERERTVDGIGDGDDGARLDGGSGQPVVDQLEADGARGPGERRLDRRGVAARPAEADVSRRVGVEGRRAGRDRVAGAADGTQRLVVDGHVLGGVGRRRDALSDDHRDRLAHVTDRVARERPARRLGHGRTVRSPDRPEAPQRTHLVGSHVTAGEHGHNS